MSLTQADADADERPVKKRIYRARWDFQPRKEDELEVRTGQLVRILSTYDDGWAYCLPIGDMNMKFGFVPLNHFERYPECLHKSSNSEAQVHGSLGNRGSDISENSSTEDLDNENWEGNGLDYEHSNNENSDNEKESRENSEGNTADDEGSNDESSENNSSEEEEDDEGEDEDSEASDTNGSDDEDLAAAAERIAARITRTQTAREEDNSSDDEDLDSESSENSSSEDDDSYILAQRIATNMMCNGILRDQMITDQLLRTRI